MNTMTIIQILLAILAVAGAILAIQRRTELGLIVAAIALGALAMVLA